MDPIFTISESAQKKLQELILEDKTITPNHFLRVGVKGGGCSGLSYDMTFDNKINEGDHNFEYNNIKVVIDKKSFLYLIGTELDYSGGLNGKGFEYKNPNATRTCGCGESFSI